MRLACSCALHARTSRSERHVCPPAGVALSVTKAVQLQVSDLLDLEKPERLTNEHMLPGGRWGGAGSQAAIRAATSIQHDVKGSVQDASILGPTYGTSPSS